MTLSEWMTENDVSPESLANMIGVHWATIYKWRSGRSFPRLDQIVAIRRLTKGAVTADDFLPSPVVSG